MDKEFNKPEKGTDNWHIPLNENFTTLEELLQYVDVDSLGQEANPVPEIHAETVHTDSIRQSDTAAPIEGPIVEAFESGSLEYYRGDIGSYALATSDLEGDGMLEIEFSNINSTEARSIQSDVISTQRGFTYSAFVKGSWTNRSEPGFLVLTNFNEDGNIIDGYQLRLNISSDSIEILKWTDGDFDFGEDADTPSLLSDTWYRIELDVGWEMLIGRVYDLDDNLLGTTTVVDTDVNGDGFGWRARGSEDGDYAAFDLLTKQPMSATPGRIKGITPGGGDIDTGGIASWDLVVRQLNNDSYEAVDSTGATIVSGSNGNSVLQSSIDECPDGGVLLFSGYYNITERIMVEDSITIKGLRRSILDNNIGNETNALYASGSEVGTDYSLDVAPDKGDYWVDLTDVSGIEEGHLIYISQDEEFSQATGGEEIGEGHVITEVDSGNNSVKLDDHIIYDNYDPSSYTVEIEVYDPIEVHFEGFHIQGQDPEGPYRGMQLFRTIDSSVRNVSLDSHGVRGLTVMQSNNVRIKNCRSDRCLRANVDGASDGYGIMIFSGCSNVIVDGCRATDCRHPISVSKAGSVIGLSRSVVIRNCFVTSDLSAAINTHGASAFDILVDGCVIYTRNQFGVRLGAFNSKIVNCTIRPNGSSAISWRGNLHDLSYIARGNTIYDTGWAFNFRRTDYDATFEELIIEGNEVVGGCNLFMYLTEAVEELQVTGNVCRNPGDHAVRISADIGSGLIAQNTFANSRNEMFRLGGEGGIIENIMFDSNRLSDPHSAHGFWRLRDGTEYCSFINNHLTAADGLNWIALEEGSSGENLYRNNMIRGASSSYALDSSSTEETTHVF